MFFIADATFLTYACLVEPGLLERHKVKSIAPCIQEARYNLRDEIMKERLVKAVDATPIQKTRPAVSGRRSLSRVDMQLLETCAASKASCALITDDSSLAYEAKKLRVGVVSTPAFVEYLVKNGLESKEAGTRFLSGLFNYYHRPSKVKAAVERIKQF